MQTEYKRILIKISGESFSAGSAPIDFVSVQETAAQIAAIARMGVQVGIVVGGGNICRGSQIAKRMLDGTRSHHMGMLATAINCIVLEDAIKQTGVDARTMSAIEMNTICEPFLRRNALAHLDNGVVVIVACGSGLPFFTTDTAAALRAAEIEADALLLAKNVDAVYSDDPIKYADGDKELIRFETITYEEYIQRNLKVLDMTCVTFCRDNNLPIVLFKREGSDSIMRAVRGDGIGTLFMK